MNAIPFWSLCEMWYLPTLFSFSSVCAKLSFRRIDDESWNFCFVKKIFSLFRWDLILRSLCSQVGAFRTSLFHFSVCCFPFSSSRQCIVAQFVFSFLSASLFYCLRLWSFRTNDIFPANFTRNFISWKEKQTFWTTIEMFLGFTQSLWCLAAEQWSMLF